MIEVTEIRMHNGKTLGWKGYGEIKCPLCGSLVKIGSGNHNFNEKLYCQECKKLFDIDYREYI
jgi:DNA-directed RNA polymerase subunit RPC12/RpoP